MDSLILASWNSRLRLNRPYEHDKEVQNVAVDITERSQKAIQVSLGTEPPVVSLQSVSKHYSGGTIALQDVNLAVAQGEFVSLLGPSGCGKSTLLRTVAGLEPASAGCVQVLGGNPETLVSHPGELAFVFQEATLMPWRTVHKNVRLPLELMRVPKREQVERAETMLDLVGLRSVSDKLPRQLSGGMKMRVSIARALVSRPKLLLLDEPFAALDEITRQRLQEELLRLWDVLGMTVLFVTHNVFEAVYLSSRVVIMRANPGCVKSEIPITAPYPRRRDMLATPEFARITTTAIQELED